MESLMPSWKCILMDPPWNEKGGGRIKRGADRHYPVMKKHDIIRTIHQSGVWTPYENCHLWMWVTNNFLKDGLFVMEALGFRYITNAVWAKDGRPGLGQYMRGKHELILFGVKGRLGSRVKDESTLIGDGLVARGCHSEKPKSSYAKIRRISPGPRLEMFARAKCRGFTPWGNEVEDAVV